MSKKKSEQDIGAKLAVIRIKGEIHLSKEHKDTLSMLNLHNQHWCVVVKNSPAVSGMLKKVKDVVTWGEIHEDIYAKLLEKRGEAPTSRQEDTHGKIKYNKYITVGEKKYKKYFRLAPPRGGFRRKGIKKSYSEGGALGYRGDAINDLLERMM